MRPSSAVSGSLQAMALAAPARVSRDGPMVRATSPEATTGAAAGLVEPGVVGVHGGQRLEAGGGGGRRHPGAGEAVAAAGERGAGDHQVGLGCLDEGQDLVDGAGGADGVVVAAPDGGHDLVVVAEEVGQLAARALGLGCRGRPAGGGVLPAHAGEELVDVVDDFHLTAVPVSLPQPRQLRRRR